VESTQTVLSVAAGRDPVLGHLPQLGSDPLPFLRSLRDQGDVVTIYFGTEPMHVVVDPRLAADVLVGRYGAFNRDAFAAASAQFVGQSVAVISGASHQGRRQLMAPYFQRARIGHYVDEMARIALARTGGWCDGDVLALDDEAFGLALATAGGCLFGTDIAQETIEDIHVQLMAALDEVGNGVADRTTGGTAEVRRIITDVVARRRAEGIDRGDLLSAFLLHPDQAGAVFTDEQAVDEVVGLLAAGVDTPAVALSWVFHELSCHPEVERRACEEIDAVVGDGPVTEDRVRSLEYLHRVIQETLRRYGAFLVPLQAEDDVDLAGVRIPAGGIIGISLYALHYDDRSFADPDRFDPDRWAPGRAAAIARGTHIPFSAGKRKCPGDLFALAELVVQVATILSRFRLVPASAEPVRAVVRGVVVRPDALPMKVIARRPR
jgi:cytochrome P450